MRWEIKGLRNLAVSERSQKELFVCSTTKENLHDFRYEGGAPIKGGPQIPVVNEKKEIWLRFQEL